MPGLLVTRDVSGAYAKLASSLAVLVQGAVQADVCAGWARRVTQARSEWTVDFEGEQFCLGRAFYTHFETGRTKAYFEDAAASDARVEEHAPGLQQTLQTLLRDAVAGRVVGRHGWCGAGVHVFPAHGTLAKSGGVVHFDTEGLAEGLLTRRAPAISLVLMIQAPEEGGALRLWPALYEGEDHPGSAVLWAGGDVAVPYEAGDLLLFDSYRCHQIQRFGGNVDRISATLHGVAFDHDLWETWF